MSITEELLADIAGTFVGRLSAVSDRNPKPIPTGEDRRRQLLRQERQHIKAITEVNTSIEEARAELRELHAERRALVELTLEVQAELRELGHIPAFYPIELRG